MDAMLAAKRAAAAEKEKSGEGLVAPTPPKERAAAADKPVKERVASAAPKKPVATEDSSESSSEVSEPAPAVSAGPSTKSSRRSRSDACPVCGAKPPHPHSRCNIVRQSSSANKRFLKTLQAEQAASPTPFREAQIKTIEELIKEKEIKEREEAKKKEAKKKVRLRTLHL
jgi:DNA repair exonuclease SbcCD ATPase subunit